MGPPNTDALGIALGIGIAVMLGALFFGPPAAVYALIWFGELRTGYEPTFWTWAVLQLVWGGVIVRSWMT